MPALRDIKRRIRSVQSTQKITKAMEMVAAAKLNRTQAKLLRMRPYARELQKLFARLSPSLKEIEHPLLAEREIKNRALLVITGDRGLCGGYNNNLNTLAEKEFKNAPHQTQLIVLGRKARDYFRHREIPLLRSYLDIGDEPSFAQAKALADEIAALYQEEIFDRLDLIYTHFVSGLVQQVRLQQFLPFTLSAAEAEEAEENKEGKDKEGEEREYIYEPSQAEILKEIIPRYLNITFFEMLLEAKTSEHSARMRAMTSASDNADDLIRTLTLKYNRARQEAITNEVTEVVRTAEALKS